MPMDTQSTSTLPPEPSASTVPEVPRSAANLDVFEQAFAAAAAVAPPDAPPDARPTPGLGALIAEAFGAGLAALGGWLEPRCPTCQVRGAISLEARTSADGGESHLWEHCRACDARWVSARCEEFGRWY